MICCFLILLFLSSSLSLQMTWKPRFLFLPHPSTVCVVLGKMAELGDPRPGCSSRCVVIGVVTLWEGECFGPQSVVAEPVQRCDKHSSLLALGPVPWPLSTLLPACVRGSLCTQQHCRHPQMLMGNVCLRKRVVSLHYDVYCDTHTPAPVPGLTPWHLIGTQAIFTQLSNHF